MGEKNLRRIWPYQLCDWLMIRRPVTIRPTRLSSSTGMATKRISDQIHQSTLKTAHFADPVYIDTQPRVRPRGEQMTLFDIMHQDRRIARLHIVRVESVDGEVVRATEDRRASRWW